MKYFCIGLNKTGTTSLRQEFIDSGFSVGEQWIGELLLDYYLNNDYKKFKKFIGIENERNEFYYLNHNKYENCKFSWNKY
jgi:hypothetical protein